MEENYFIIVIIKSIMINLLLRMQDSRLLAYLVQVAIDFGALLICSTRLLFNLKLNLKDIKEDHKDLERDYLKIQMF